MCPHKREKVSRRDSNQRAQLQTPLRLLKYDYASLTFILYRLLGSAGGSMAGLFTFGLNGPFSSEYHIYLILIDYFVINSSINTLPTSVVC